MLEAKVNYSVIELKDIGKKYPLPQSGYTQAQGHLADFWAIKDISFKVSGGEVLGIIGRNGSGKTTLLNIIAGTLSASQGDTEVRGKTLGLFNLGVGFQDELTGKENIFLNGAILGAAQAELENKLSEIMEFSELGDFINMPLGSYSQGMRLRLAFSIIANLEFDILVIDEILAVGDVLFQNKCFERLMDLRRAGKTLIITSQAVDLIERLCDRAILLEHGRFLFNGSPAETINKYRQLLNTEKFSVGLSQRNDGWIESTKKWADDIGQWNAKLGTREAVIDSVKFINRFGLPVKSIKSGQPLTIKVNFKARNLIKNPHFGIAIFREDGVYCYGPNTQFDGHEIAHIKPGRGNFSLNYNNVWLAPGSYRLSVAVWDKNETLPFDYHNGGYQLIIKGQNQSKALTAIKFSCKNEASHIRPDLNKGETKENAAQNKIISVEIVDSKGINQEKFVTGEPAKVRVTLPAGIEKQKHCYLWIGIYRDDGIYCQGVTQHLPKEQTAEICFTKFSFLPGKYFISAGIWDDKSKDFLVFNRQAKIFIMTFNRQDHGTVYLEHQWGYKLP